MNWWHNDCTSTAKALQTNMQTGLSIRETKNRYERVGPNRLQDNRSISSFALLLNQFNDFMVLVLLLATLISGLLGEYTDAITIIAIVILNALFGFTQEYRAEQSLQALKQLTAPTAHVIREGELTEIAAEEIVPGDIVYFEAGDRIPADLRICMASDVQIDEAALTGESVPVEKHAEPLDNEEVDIGDQLNMAFMGTMVTNGAGQGIVVRTGMDTEMGKIAELIQNTDSVITPLKSRLEQLGKVLIFVALLLTVGVVVTGIWHGHDAYTMFLAGVSLAVAAIPEGLPAIVTIALALGVQRMIRRKAIVRKLPAVETLGCASVICSDKTGTLTENKMTVKEIVTNGKTIYVSGSGYDPSGTFEDEHGQFDANVHVSTTKLLTFGALCTNAVLQEEKDSGGKWRSTTYWDIVGDPTEGALVVAAAKAGIWKQELDQSWTRRMELPFSSDRKMMSVIVRDNSGKEYVISKGAPEEIIKRCTRYTENGKSKLLGEREKQALLQQNEQMASHALRNLAIASRPLRFGEQLAEADVMEQNLEWMGVIGMIDPPRPEAQKAIGECHSAGIRTVMITGDHQRTAEAIADQLGILSNNGSVITGKQLTEMDDKELGEVVGETNVYARVSPHHKLRIVQALQTNGHVVAMTGDGVNDAPALKASDIGIAMGITGTDVAKEASALILSDDNFATIRSAIEEGRRIFENIRKFIRYMLASNVGEILVMFFAMLLAMPLPLVPIQILWVNLVTDGLPAMALGVDSAEKNVMSTPPRKRTESIFARGLAWKIVSRGLLIGLTTLAAFWITLQAEPDNLIKAQTVAFCTLVMAQLIHVFDCRSDISIFHRNPFENKWLIVAVLVSTLMLVAVIYTESLQPIFRTVALDATEWMFILAFAALPSVLLSLIRIVFYRSKRLV